MDVRAAIENRRAVRKFDPAHRMTEDEVRGLMSLALLSPSAFNIQHGRFVLVRDATLREEIRAACWMQPQVTDASLLVVVCADLAAWRKAPERYWQSAPAEVREGLLEAMRGHYEGRPEFQRDEAMRSCGIAAQTLMLAARGMGYATCPMDLGDMAAVARLIDLPADHAIAMLVAVGKGVEAPGPRERLAYEAVIKVDRF